MIWIFSFYDFVASTVGLKVDLLNSQVAKLRELLSIRGLSTKGLKAQLLSRLTEAIEGEKTAAEADAEVDMEESTPEDGTTETHKVVGVEELKSETEAEAVDSTTTINECVVDEFNSKEEIKQEVDGDSEKSGEIPVPYGDVLVPLVPDDADEKTKEMWRRRFSLPKKPHLLVHPLQTGKTQDFDCSKMSLASIREYRVHEVKEASFEVNLFSGKKKKSVFIIWAWKLLIHILQSPEFFNEMLARDFAFKIYKEAAIRTQLTPTLEESDKKIDRKDKIKDEKGTEGKKDEKRKDEKAKNDKSSDDDDKKTKEKEVKKEGSDGKKLARKGENSGVDSGESKKSSRPSSAKTTDSSLLLAFSFYDTSRCGYIKEVDFEEICLISGLSLTRAQVTSIIQ